MSAVLLFLRTPIGKWVAGGVVLLLAFLALSGYFGVRMLALKAEIKAKDVQIAALQTENGNLKSDNAGLTAANFSQSALISEQNAAIKTLRDDAQARKELAAQKIKQVEAARAQWRDAYAKIINRPAPPPDQECAAVNMMLKDYFDQRSKEHATPVADPPTIHLDTGRVYDAGQDDLRAPAGGSPGVGTLRDRLTDPR